MNDQQRSNGEEKYLLMWEVLAPRHQYGLVLKAQEFWIQNYRENFRILYWGNFYKDVGHFESLNMKIWITSNGNADYSTFLISQMTKLLLPQIPLIGEELALSNLQFKRGQL